MDRELRNEALAELCALVEDWKNHEVTQFGDLLLHGQFTVVTGKSDIEKEVRDFISIFKRQWARYTAKAVIGTARGFFQITVQPPRDPCGSVWAINRLIAYSWSKSSSIQIS